MEQLERRLIEEALRNSGGNKQKAAQVLGLSRPGLIKELKQLGGVSWCLVWASIILFWKLSHELSIFFTRGGTFALQPPSRGQHLPCLQVVNFRFGQFIPIGSGPTGNEMPIDSIISLTSGSRRKAEAESFSKILLPTPEELGFLSFLFHR